MSNVSPFVRPGPLDVVDGQLVGNRAERQAFLLMVCNALTAAGINRSRHAIVDVIDERAIERGEFIQANPTLDVPSAEPGHIVLFNPQTLTVSDLDFARALAER